MLVSKKQRGAYNDSAQHVQLVYTKKGKNTKHRIYCAWRRPVTGEVKQFLDTVGKTWGYTSAFEKTSNFILLAVKATSPATYG